MASMISVRPSGKPTFGLVRARIERGEERLWRLADFSDLPTGAAAKALSRLAAEGVLERLGKGLYYRGRSTKFGASRPKTSARLQLAARAARIFPAGVAAASSLGLSTQMSMRAEVSTTATSLPGLLLGADILAHTRRPAAWNRLSDREAAILEVLRNGGHTVDLAPSAALDRLVSLLREDSTFDHLVRAASTEPPRVRALLGALGELAKCQTTLLERLRASLHPLSRFDFGIFGIAANARAWQAKVRRVA